MFIDTSIIVAITLGEQVAVKFSDRIENSTSRLAAGHHELEACTVMSSRKELNAEVVMRTMNHFLTQNEIQVLDFTREVSEAAVVAFNKFVKGRNSKTALNLADCMSHAFAKIHKLKILYTGTDDKGTDLKAA
jgi:ribonuclease VapC